MTQLVEHEVAKKTALLSKLASIKKKIVIGPTKSAAISSQIQHARKAGDANLLDIALRAEFHFANRGKSVDTTDIEFPEVKMLNPAFYG